jgi:hypothetical protein
MLLSFERVDRNSQASNANKAISTTITINKGFFLLDERFSDTVSIRMLVIEQKY